MSIRIDLLKKAISPVRDRLTGHPVYSCIRTPASLCTFMEFHVYAVWDFMSLLKTLQQSLTCVDVPWVPRGSANARYLINEIVLGEESDLDEQGRRTSHFELYMRAMHQAGADTGPVAGIMTALSAGGPLAEALDAIVAGGPVRDFLNFTFGTIEARELHKIAAVFTFGREDLIPDMFLQIVGGLSDQLASTGPGLSFGIFTYYLERHIEVDGDHHSHLAMAMLEELCGDDDQRWEEAADSAKEALEMRILLWDGVLKMIGAHAGITE